MRGLVTVNNVPNTSPRLACAPLSFTAHGGGFCQGWLLDQKPACSSPALLNVYLMCIFMCIFIQEPPCCGAAVGVLAVDHVVKWQERFVCLRGTFIFASPNCYRCYGGIEECMVNALYCKPVIISPCYLTGHLCWQPSLVKNSSLMDSRHHSRWIFQCLLQFLKWMMTCQRLFWCSASVHISKWNFFFVLLNIKKHYGHKL